MNDNTELKALFAALRGILPYEYDERYVTGAATEDSIVIGKTDSERIACISANVFDDDVVLDVTLYDDANDEEPIEISQWDTDDPNFNLADTIDYIKKAL